MHAEGVGVKKRIPLKDFLSGKKRRPALPSIDFWLSFLGAEPQPGWRQGACTEHARRGWTQSVFIMA